MGISSCTLRLSEIIGSIRCTREEIEVVLFLGACVRCFPTGSLGSFRPLAYVVGEVLRWVELIGWREASVIPPVQVKTEVGFDTEPIEEVASRKKFPII